MRGADTASPTAAGEDHQRAGDPLLGRRILIVEDDPYIMLALEEALAEHGLVIVGSARTLESALQMARGDLDLALLDVNLGTERIDAVADLLAARGRPFIFTSGCGRVGLPEAHTERPIVEKPFYVEEVLRALRDEVSRILP